MEVSVCPGVGDVGEKDDVGDTGDVSGTIDVVLVS